MSIWEKRTDPRYMKDTRQGPPAFNVPPVILWLIGIFAAIYGIQALLVVPEPFWQQRWLATFAFIPLRFSDLIPYVRLDFAQMQDAIEIERYALGGSLLRWLSFVSHMFLHADLMHLGFNSLWLLAFGPPVARRLGTARFVTLFLICGVAGAAVHLVLFPDSWAPLIGASGGVSGLMGAAGRLLFSGRSFTGLPLQSGPLASLTQPQLLTFIVLFNGINLLFGVSSFGLTGEGQSIAWDAHMGGFFAGLFLIGLLDRRVRPA